MGRGPLSGLGHRRPDQRGLAHTAEAALLLPAVMVLLLGLIQLGTYWHARNAALAAAQLTAEQSRALDGTTATAAGLRIVNQARILDPSIRVDRSAQQVRVTVTGSAQLFVAVPGVGGIEETAIMPVERLSG